VGFIDIYNIITHDLWELKLVKQVGPEHFIQTAIYYWMLKQLNLPVGDIHLFNILDNLHYILTIDDTHLEQLIRLLIDCKKCGQKKHDDQQFLDQCQTIRHKLESHPPEPAPPQPKSGKIKITLKK
jgi:hypothetical protein